MRDPFKNSSEPTFANSSCDERSFGSPLNYAVAQRDAQIVDMVANAVRFGEAQLAFQPVVRAACPDAVAYHEGLIRIPDKTGRIIPAQDFVETIEHLPLGRTIDALALDLGCETLARFENLRLSINMSARSIGYGPWLDTLNRWLQRDDSIGPRLVLEITEHSAMTVPELVVSFMDKMQERGICFALDDFGAGNTAFRYFKEFFFDILKIDGQFIRGIAQDPDQRVLAQAMFSIGKHFDMLCVAEMVENAEDARVAAEIGADCLQGTYFGAPQIRPTWFAGLSGDTNDAQKSG